MTKNLISLALTITALSISMGSARADEPLTPEEREILDQGEIPMGRYIAGGIVGTAVGLGIGNAIEGRYLPYGLIFTIGEAVSTGLIIAGYNSCVVTGADYLADSSGPGNGHCLGTTGAIGLVGLIGFHIWETIDVWTAPPRINRRYRALKQRAQYGSFGVLPAFAQANDGVTNIDGAALAYQFHF